MSAPVEPAIVGAAYGGPSMHVGPRPDRLAHAFLKRLARDERRRLRFAAEDDGELDGAEPSDGGDPLGRTVARDGDGRTGHVPIRADLAATAVLVARAFEAEPDLLCRLRRGAPVIILATHVAGLVGPVRTVLEACAFAPGVRARALTRDIAPTLREGHVGILVRDGNAKDHRASDGNDVVAVALHARVPIVGVAPDPKRHLPRDLVRAAEHRLTLPMLDHGALDLVVEAVVGERPTKRIDDALLSGLEIADLPIALRNAISADGSIDAIRRILSEKTDHLADGPGLEELHGYGEAKDWGMALAADLQAYRAGRLGWSEIDGRGLLLSGPPGVGKTSFAQALARTARVPLVATSVAEWNSAEYLSGTLRAIDKVFDTARAKAPCILFIDEMDGISDRARFRDDYVEYWTQIVNRLLEHLSGVEDRPGVVVVAATNLPDRIDPAVRRAGRLDREIAIGLPDAATLAGILRHHLGPDRLANVPLMPAALAARGGTGADVEAFVRRASGAARRAGRAMAEDDLLKEIRRGRAPLAGDVRRRASIHEAGHAVVSRATGFGSIVDLSLHDGGGELTLDRALDGAATLPQLEALLASMMAGRIAEEVAFGGGAIGAGLGPGSDLAISTRVARDIELLFGLGDFGPIHVEPSANDLLLVPGLLAAVSARLTAASDRARKILSERWQDVERIAGALAEAGHLAAADVDRLLRTTGDGFGTSDRIASEDAGKP